MTKTLSSVLLLSSLVALAGCGGGSSGSTTSSTSETSGGQEVAGETDGFDMEGFEEGEATIQHGTQSARALLGVHAPPQPWDSMSEADQVNWMVGNVLPIAAEDFRTYDAERFSNLTCEGCHGENAEANHYHLPVASLPQLPAPGSPQWEQMSHSPGYAFMHDVVTPTMATLIGEEPFNPATGQGFGCFDCHVQRPAH